MVLDCVSTCLVVCHGVHLFDCEFVCHCVRQYTVMSWYIQSCHGECVYHWYVTVIRCVLLCHGVYRHVTVCTIMSQCHVTHILSCHGPEAEGACAI